jgi:superfamily I DNA/RNA helicase
MPNALLEALRRVPQRFDALVVDEGQDFLEAWWYPLQFCLADPDRGVLYVFHDDNQQVYRRAPSFPSGLIEVTLHENLRNTQRIHAVTSRFYRGEPVRAVGPEGRFVEGVVVGSKDDIEQAVSGVLERLIKKEYASPEDIAVLLGWAPSSPLKRDTQIGEFQVTRDQAAEPGRILLESVRRFKGLERPIVVLTAIDELPPEEADALLYVGLSRARIHLVVVAKASTIARLGIDTRC